MILIFDLDDTLYPEHSDVASGFRAVADHLRQRHGVVRRREVQACVHVYCHHRPMIRLAPEAEALLARLPRRPDLVTDGHKVVQAAKVVALQLAPRLARADLTHR